MNKINLNIVVWKESKHYVSQCLNTNISSFGDTKEASLVNLKEALELYFEDEQVANIVEIEKPELIQTSLTYA